MLIIRYILVFIFLLAVNLIHSQIMILSVIDEDYNGLSDCEIYKNDTLIAVLEHEKNTIELPINSKDVVLIKKEMFKAARFEISQAVSKEDTLLKTVFLIPEYQKLDEVIISDSDYKTIFQKENHFIIDYHPLPNNKVLIANRIKGINYLRLISEDDKINHKLTLSFKPKKIEQDAFGNIHLLSKDSVYQLSIKEESNNFIAFVAKITVHDYNQYISNLICIQNNRAVFQQLMEHNQYYQLICHQKNREDAIIYSSFDESRYKNAISGYNKAIRRYFEVTPESENVILLGLWDGKLMHLPSNDKKLLQMTAWYETIVSKPLNVTAFGMLNNLVVLDGVKDSIILINHKNNEIKEQVNANFKMTNNYFLDYFHDKLYMISNEKSGMEIYKINIASGTTEFITKIKSIHHPRNIKVSNNHVYFTAMEENGFNRLYKLLR